MKVLLSIAAIAAAGVAQANDDVPLPHQMPLSGAIFKFHKGASQAFLERYIPDLKCQPFMGEVVCLAPVDEISQLFIRNVKCIGPRPISFSIKAGKAIAASCHVEQAEARRLSEAHGKRFGAAKVEQKDVPPMLGRQESWRIGGGDAFMVTHFYGQDTRGRAIDDYLVRMGPQ